MGNIALLWENFGPHHISTCEAVADAVAPGRRVIGIELFARSATYEWGRWRSDRFDQVTLFEDAGGKRPGTVALARRIVRAVRRGKASHVFMGHYQDRHILLAALWLRLLGRRLYTMTDSKFDDYRRYLGRERGKRWFMKPYHGGLSAGRRGADYMRFLGLDERFIRTGYDTIDLDRLRRVAAVPPAPDGPPHGERHFICVARLVPKKNHAMLIDAYARYRAATPEPRRLILCGSGPLETDIRAQIEALGLTDYVELRGNVAPDAIAGEIGRSLALLLPSLEEQYGIAVIEAQALGLPVIVGENVGARDLQVRAGVDGFVVEPDNAEGLAYFMGLLAGDEALWRRMSMATRARWPTADVARFVDAVLDLTAGG